MTSEEILNEYNKEPVIFLSKRLAETTFLLDVLLDACDLGKYKEVVKSTFQNNQQIFQSIPDIAEWINGIGKIK